MLVRFFGNTTAVLSGVTASLLVAAPVAAAREGPVVVYAQPSAVRVERVSYADLNLAQISQAKKLERRVAGAVKRVCLYENSVRGLQDLGHYSCSRESWEEARPQIALAVARARQIALTGRSSIPATPITIGASDR